MMILKRYMAADQPAWDDFVRDSKNGWFLFERSYMDYHADRFNDHSLLVYDEKARLIALLPANQRDDTLISHAGLTYGGLITGGSMKTTLMLEVFDYLRLYCVNQGIGELIYKTIPHLYCRLPADEDRYALYVNGGELIDRQVITAIDQRARVPFAHGRLYGIKKASKAGVQINTSDDLARYWAILGEVLQTRHQADPVHTLSEIRLLRERFPDNIRLYAATIDSDIVAGVLMYVSEPVARTQYIAANEQAKRLGALDLLLDHLINKEYAQKRYFDFGTSHNPSDAQLNFGLIKQKESFGGRAVVCDIYRLRI
jgi:GNAT acetyltransferase-like protein